MPQPYITGSRRHKVDNAGILSRLSDTVTVVLWISVSSCVQIRADCTILIVLISKPGLNTLCPSCA